MNYRVTTETDERAQNELLELEQILQRSRLSKLDATRLAAEVKREAWERVKHLFMPDKKA